MKRNKKLDSVTLPRQWNFEINQGGGAQFNKNYLRPPAPPQYNSLPVPPQSAGQQYGPPVPPQPDPFAQGSMRPPGGQAQQHPVTRWVSPRPDHRNPHLAQYMERFLARVGNVHFTIILTAGDNTVSQLPQWRGRTPKEKKRGLCIQHCIATCNKNDCQFYHAPAREVDKMFAQQLLESLKKGMEFIWKWGIGSVPARVWNVKKKRKW